MAHTNPIENIGTGENHTQKATVIGHTGGVTGRTFLKFQAAPNVYTSCGAGEQAGGVALWDIAATEAGTMVEIGHVAVLSGAAVAAGAEVMSNAAGKAITGTATNLSLGQALTAASGADELILVKLYNVGQTLA